MVGILTGAWLILMSAPALAQELSRDAATRQGADRGPGVAIARAPDASYRDALSESGALLVHSPRGLATGGHRASSIGGGLEASVSLVQDISLRGVAARRADSAHALLAATHADVSRARQAAAGRAAIAWSTAREAEELLALRKASTLEAETLARLAAARVTAGTGMPSEIAMAQGELALANANELDGEGMLTEAMSELRFAMGLPPDAAIDPGGSLEAPKDPPLDGAAALRTAFERSPLLPLAAARRDLATSDAALAFAQQAPTLGLGASYTHEGTGDSIWSAIVAFPLPFANPGGYESARQMGAASVAGRELELARADLARMVALAVHECQHTRETHAALGRALAPLESAAEMARAQLEAGTSDATLLAFARQRLLAARERSLHAAAEIQRADTRLLLTVGDLLGDAP